MLAVTTNDDAFLVTDDPLILAPGSVEKGFPFTDRVDYKTRE